MKIKQKYTDFGRCLVCLKNPCECKKDLRSEFTQKMEWLREFLDGPHSTYEGDGLEFTESLTQTVNELITEQRMRTIEQLHELLGEYDMSDGTFFGYSEERIKNTIENMKNYEQKI